MKLGCGQWPGLFVVWSSLSDSPLFVPGLATLSWATVVPRGGCPGLAVSPRTLACYSAIAITKEQVKLPHVTFPRPLLPQGPQVVDIFKPAPSPIYQAAP